MAASTPSARNSSTVAWELIASARLALACVVMSGHALWFKAAAPAWALLGDAFSGKTAVVAFLLISGYSIGASLEREPRRFYQRRLLRVYPLYFFAVGFAILLEIAARGPLELPAKTLEPLGGVTAIGNLLMLQSFLVRPITFDGPVWSLSIEVFFYLLAPLFARLSQRQLLALVVISIGFYALPRHDDWGPAYWVLTRINALNFLWPWLLGFLLWRDRSVPTVAITLACSALIFYGSRTQEPYAIVTYILTAGLLLGARRISLPWFRTVGNYLGDVSYPLYLFHLPVFIFAYAFLGMRSPAWMAVLAVATSVAAFHLIDRALKRRVLEPLLLGKPSRQDRPATTVRL